jgi:hypothetical protein
VVILRQLRLIYLPGKPSVDGGQGLTSNRNSVFNAARTIGHAQAGIGRHHGEATHFSSMVDLFAVIVSLLMMLANAQTGGRGRRKPDQAHGRRR